MSQSNGISLELSKSGRATCKARDCKAIIAKGVPRWAEEVEVELGEYGGNQLTNRYFHIACGLQMPQFRRLFGTKDTVDDHCDEVAGFADLSRADQDYVCDKAEEALGGKRAAPYWQLRADDADSDADADADDSKAAKKARAKRVAKKANAKAALLPEMVEGSALAGPPPSSAIVKASPAGAIGKPGDSVRIESAPPPPQQWLASKVAAGEETVGFGAKCRDCGEPTEAGDTRITYVHMTKTGKRV